MNEVALVCDIESSTWRNKMTANKEVAGKKFPAASFF
jgi:hypothetical protein